jgi:predicted DNA-binding protein (MmcQ/YjbR family)
MDITWVRQYCLSLPHAEEKVQWEDDLVFKVGGKMFAIVALEPGSHWLSFKCSSEEFASLIERAGVVPAPYLARAEWVALETEDALPRAEIKQLLRQAYDLIVAKLPKKTRAVLPRGRSRGAPSRARRA